MLTSSSAGSVIDQRMYTSSRRLLRRQEWNYGSPDRSSRNSDGIFGEKSSK